MLCILIISTFACPVSADETGRPSPARQYDYPSKPSVPSIAMIGDSITWGQEGAGEARTKHPLPAQISNYLDIVCDNYGKRSLGYCNVVGGHNVLKRIQSIKLSKYNTIMLCGCVNPDIKRSYPDGLNNEVKGTTLGNYIQCLKYLRKRYPKITIIVLPSFLYGNATPQKTQVWHRMREIAKQYGAYYINPMTTPIDEKLYNTVWGGENMHPSAEGYAIAGKWLTNYLSDFFHQKTSVINFAVNNIKDRTYTGKKQTPSIQVSYRGKKLKSGRDYTISYANNRNKGQAKVIIHGIGKYVGHRTVNFKIKPVSIQNVQLKYSSKTYTGKKVTQTNSTVVQATVKGKKNTLVKGRDYTITYANNRKVGTATLTVKGKGNFRGTIQKNFNIIPQRPEITSIKENSKNEMVIQWLSRENQFDHCQVQISRSADFSKNTATLYCSVNSGKKYTSVSFASLRNKTTYYVRVRGCKRVNRTRIYSKWSPVRKFKSLVRKDGLNSKSSLPKADLVFRDKSFKNVQGLCTDGDRYIYAACRKGKNTASADKLPVTLKKIDQNGRVVASNGETCYCHANGITYCSADRNLYIATLGRGSNASSRNPVSPQNYNVIGIADGKTLKNKGFFSVQKEMLSQGACWIHDEEPGFSRKISCPRIGSVHYDRYHDRFICSTNKYKRNKTDRGSILGIAVFDRSWHLTAYYEHHNIQGHAGSMTTDGKYYYLSLDTNSGKDHFRTARKKLAVFDQKFRHIKNIYFRAVSEAELECIDFIGSDLYASFNTNPITIARITLS